MSNVTQGIKEQLLLLFRLTSILNKVGNASPFKKIFRLLVFLLKEWIITDIRKIVYNYEFYLAQLFPI